MKKIFIILLVVPFAFACKNKELDALKAKSDSMAFELKHRDSTINNFFESFNQIEANLDTIKKKEKIVTVSATSGDMAPDIKDRINSDVQLIYDLMQQNKKTIAHLRKQMKKSDLRIIELEKTIATLTKQIEERDLEISQLKEKLEKMNFQLQILTSNVDSLSSENKSKDAVIGSKTEALNTAYYAFGTQKELIANKIITKEGGFIGIGKSAKLADNFNKEYFTKVDIKKVNSIDIKAKKAKLLTSHPSSSYKFEGTASSVDKLIILNAEEFWSVSKYLVIQVE
jgi:hypothetical protein